MAMIIRDLDFFLSIAETGQLARAAEAKGETETTVANGLRRLEAEIGLPLFERVGQGMKLTAFGEEFQPRAYRICTRYQDLVRQAEDFRTGKAGAFRVSGSLVTLKLLIEPALADLWAQVPSIQAETGVTSDESLIEQLERGQIDIAVVPLVHKPPPQLTHITVWEGHLVPVVRKHHPLTALSAPRIEDLAAYSWVSPIINDPAAQKKFQGVYADAGIEAIRTAIGSNMVTLTGKPSPLILQTDLITYMVEHVAEAYADQVTVLPFRQLRQPAGASAVFRTKGYWSPVLDAFVKALVAVGSNPLMIRR